MSGAPAPVAISLRLYRALARAFPWEFQNAWGEELVQVTEDAIESIWRRYGVPGLVRLLADIAVRVPAEHLAELRQDVRYGLRTLRGSPGFTAVALLSLALGISVATCAFSELNGLVLRTLPGVPNPGELVAPQSPTSYPQYRRYRELRGLFSSTLAYTAPVPFSVSLNGRTERTWGHLVTSSYFSTLGVRPALGRFFGDEHERPGEAPSVVVSHRFWRERLGSDPLVVGKALRINGYPAAVIGVGPKDFLGASPGMFAADLWMPLSVGERVAPELADHALDRHELAMFQVVLRLKAGAGAARAEAALDAVARQFEQDHGEPDRARKGRRVLLIEGGRMLPLRKQDIPYYTVFFLVLGGLVVLIACSNVANMMLARAADRRREIAVRLALGASRARLVRQLLTESMLLACGAGALGFLVSIWVMHGASQIRMPYPMPVRFDLTPDARALLFTFVLMLITGLAFGLAPALRATRTDLTPALKEGGTVQLRRFRRLSLRNLLVVHQVAGSLTLLMLTAFLVSDVQKRMTVEVGFNTKRLYLIALDPARDGYTGERAAVFFSKLLDRVRRLPSVEAACLTDTVPMAMNGNRWLSISTTGMQAGSERRQHGAQKYVVGKDYFETTGTPILLGRGFRGEDEAGDGRVVVISEGLGSELWPGEDPLGRRLEIANQEAGTPRGIAPGTFDYRLGALGKTPRTFEVVGVSRDMKADPFAPRMSKIVYFPMRPAGYAQPSLQGVTLLVRAAPGADAIGAVRREVSAIDAGLTPFDARSMADQVNQFTYVIHLASSVYGAVGIFGLILASVGLAGVTAYSVSQRRREIGIRMALGARSADVLGLVMKEGAVLVAVGTVIGLAGAWAGVRVLAAVFFTIGNVIGMSTSPVLLAGAPLLLAVLALVACYVPARKSMRVDPVQALRQE